MLNEGDGQGFFGRPGETPSERASVTAIVPQWQPDPDAEVYVQKHRLLIVATASALTVPP